MYAMCERSFVCYVCILCMSVRFLCVLCMRLRFVCVLCMLRMYLCVLRFHVCMLGYVVGAR